MHLILQKSIGLRAKLFLIRLQFKFIFAFKNWFLLLNNAKVTWSAFVWETFQTKPRQQIREFFLFVDKNTLNNQGSYYSSM